MKRMKWLILFLVGILVFLSCLIQAAELKGKRVAIGLNFPGLQIKWRLGPKVSWEGKAQFGEKTLVVGPRFYYSPKPFWYWGIEIDYIYSRGVIARGKGGALEFFVGSEYFFHRQPTFSLFADLGPVYILLRDTLTTYEHGSYYITAFTVSSLDIVANLGINWYFR